MAKKQSPPSFESAYQWSILPGDKRGEIILFQDTCEATRCAPPANLHLTLSQVPQLIAGLEDVLTANGRNTRGAGTAVPLDLSNLSNVIFQLSVEACKEWIEIAQDNPFSEEQLPIRISPLQVELLVAMLRNAARARSPIRVAPDSPPATESPVAPRKPNNI